MKNMSAVNRMLSYIGEDSLAEYLQRYEPQVNRPSSTSIPRSKIMAQEEGAVINAYLSDISAEGATFTNTTAQDFYLEDYRSRKRASTHTQTR